MSSADDFDWYGDDSIACRAQPAIAVYRNPAGEIIIRQEREWCDNEDTFVRIQPENARQLAEAILRLTDDPHPLALPPPRAPTRQDELDLEGAR